MPSQSLGQSAARSIHPATGTEPGPDEPSRRPLQISNREREKSAPSVDVRVRWAAVPTAAERQSSPTSHCSDEPGMHYLSPARIVAWATLAGMASATSLFATPAAGRVSALLCHGDVQAPVNAHRQARAVRPSAPCSPRLRANSFQTRPGRQARQRREFIEQRHDAHNPHEPCADPAHQVTHSQETAGDMCWLGP